jgi:hypothetical protein
MTEETKTPEIKHRKAKLAATCVMAGIAIVAWGTHPLWIQRMELSEQMNQNQQDLLQKLRSDTTRDPFAASCADLKRTITFDMQLNGIYPQVEANNLLLVMNRKCPVEKEEKK